MWTLGCVHLLELGDTGTGTGMGRVTGRDACVGCGSCGRPRTRALCALSLYLAVVASWAGCVLCEGGSSKLVSTDLDLDVAGWDALGSSPCMRASATVTTSVSFASQMLFGIDTFIRASCQSKLLTRQELLIVPLSPLCLLHTSRCYRKARSKDKAGVVATGPTEAGRAQNAGGAPGAAERNGGAAPRPGSKRARQQREEGGSEPAPTPKRRAPAQQGARGRAPAAGAAGWGEEAAAGEPGLGAEGHEQEHEQGQEQGQEDGELVAVVHQVEELAEAVRLLCGVSSRNRRVGTAAPSLASRKLRAFLRRHFAQSF